VNPKNAVILGLKIVARQGDWEHAAERAVAWQKIAFFHDSKRISMLFLFKHVEIATKEPSKTLDFRHSKATKVQWGRWLPPWSF